MAENENRWEWCRRLIGMIWYEIMLHYRRRGLVTLTVAVAILLALLIPGMPLLLPPPDENMPEWVWLLSPGQMLASVTMAAIVIALPALLADTIPLDRRQGMRELLKSLPLSDGVYLAGKVLGVLGASTLLWGGVILFEALLIRIAIGPFQSQFYLAQIILAVVPAFLFVACASVLLAVGQRSQMGSALVGIALTGYSLVISLVTSTGAPRRWGILSPASGIAFSYSLDKWGAPFGIYTRSYPVSATDVTLTLALGLFQLVVLALTAWIWLRRKEGI